MTPGGEPGRWLERDPASFCFLNVLWQLVPACSCFSNARAHCWGSHKGTSSTQAGLLSPSSRLCLVEPFAQIFESSSETAPPPASRFIPWVPCSLQWSTFCCFSLSPKGTLWCSNTCHKFSVINTLLKNPAASIILTAFCPSYHDRSICVPSLVQSSNPIPNSNRFTQSNLLISIGWIHEWIFIKVQDPQNVQDPAIFYYSEFSLSF